MEMTEDAIRRNYREAKYKAWQIPILAQLNDCGTDTIREILGLSPRKRRSREKSTQLRCTYTIQLEEFYYSDQREAVFLYEDAQEARERIAEIIRGHVEEDGWIPCSQRMPENDGFYLATIDGEIAGEDKPFSGLAEFENGKWIDDEEDYQCIIAWQPLPEPYRPGQKTVGEDYKRQIMGRFLRQD